MSPCKLLVGKGGRLNSHDEIMLPIRFIFQKPMTGNQGSEKQRHPVKTLKQIWESPLQPLRRLRRKEEQLDHHPHPLLQMKFWGSDHRAPELGHGKFQTKTESTLELPRRREGNTELKVMRREGISSGSPTVGGFMHQQACKWMTDNCRWCCTQL